MVQPRVFAGLFPVSSDDYESFRDALQKLKLNDSALHYEPEVSTALGFGFRCGFLGLLHMDIVQERLEREYDMDLITTAPTVVYQVVQKDGTVIDIKTGAKVLGHTPNGAGGTTVQFAAEDPFIWHDGDRYRGIVKDNNGIFTGRGYSLAHWESRDGFDWRPAKHVFVTTPEIVWTDGARKKLDALERPQLIFDARGVPVVLLCAGAYTADRGRSFNVAIPLRRPLRQ